MTELSFLLELLLNHKLTKPTREAVTARIKEVEGKLVAPVSHSTVSVFPMLPQATAQRPTRPKTAQSPSTQAILDEKFTPDEIEKMAGGEPIEPQPLPTPEAPGVPPPPVTPMAAQALQQRQAAIMKAVNAGPFGGKPEDGRTSPRKF